jgi:hypothetical protein
MKPKRLFVNAHIMDEEKSTRSTMDSLGPTSPPGTPVFNFDKLPTGNMREDLPVGT